MTIGVDLRCLPNDGTPGAGVAHAARELWHALVRERADLVGFAPRGASLGSPSVVWLPDSTGASLRRALKHHRVDALFVASGAVPWGIDVPVYPWVHDVAIFEHPEWFPQPWLKRQLTTRLFLRGLKRAKHIFCVSENTKQSLIHRFGFDPKQVTVTLQGVEREEGVMMATGTGSFALVMGTVEPRKNISFLISLWPEVCKRVGHAVDLVIAGADGWGKDAKEISVKAKGKSIVRKKHVSDEEYRELLGTTRMLLTPSLYEGFGRPAIEAMTWGVPVVVSDRGALPEVVGDGGLVLSLDDRAKWVESVVRLFTDQKYWDEWNANALKRSEKFSWEKVSRIILDMLAKA